MRRSCAALIATVLLSAAAPVGAYSISAQLQLGLGGPFEDSTTEEEVSASYYDVDPTTLNRVDMSSSVSGASGLLNGRSRMDTVGGGMSGNGKWTALLRENLILDADPGETEIVVRGSLQVVHNSSALFYPASVQGHAFQTVRLNIAFGGANPSVSDIQAHGSTRQSSSDGFLWDDASSASPPESATAVGSLETGSVDLELRIPAALINPATVLRVEALVNGEAQSGNHPTSYAESALDTQLTLDVQGGTYIASLPFFLAPEPDGALLGCIALMTLSVRAARRTRA